MDPLSGPQCPPTPPMTPPANEGSGLFANFAREYEKAAIGMPVAGVLDALLKAPARLTRELVEGKRALFSLVLLGWALLSMAAYGLLVGSYAGGGQLFAVPIKLAAGLAASMAICLPSLHILTSLCGSRLVWTQVSGFLAQALALSGCLLLGFAPVSWIFSQSTDTIAFMGFLHFSFWIAAAWLGLRLLRRIFGHLSPGTSMVVRVWTFIFLVVTFQMVTALRPLLGDFQGLELQGKLFFLKHWLQSL